MKLRFFAFFVATLWFWAALVYSPEAWVFIVCSLNLCLQTAALVAAAKRVRT